MLDTDWIVLLSAAALGFSVMNYVLLDGTDLGVGVLMGCSAEAAFWRCFRWPTPSCCRPFICLLS